MKRFIACVAVLAVALAALAMALAPPPDAAAGGAVAVGGVDWGLVVGEKKEMKRKETPLACQFFRSDVLLGMEPARRKELEAENARLKKQLAEARAEQVTKAKHEAWARDAIARIEQDFGDILPTGRARTAWREAAIREWSDPRRGKRYLRLAIASLQRAKADRR